MAWLRPSLPARCLQNYIRVGNNWIATTVYFENYGALDKSFSTNISYLESNLRATRDNTTHIFLHMATQFDV